MDEYVPSRADLAAIAARHAVDVRELRPAPSGVANRVFLLGDELVLRIPRTRSFLADLAKEAVVVPAARRAGVRAPDIRTFDDSGTTADVPYMVLTRVPGTDLARLRPPAEEARRVYRETGRELARLHRLHRLHRLDPATRHGLSTLPEDGAGPDPRALVTGLLTEGWLDPEAASWLTDWFDRLRAHLPAEPAQVLVHGDLAPQNLMATPHPATLTGIVDWGDAQWADPATEFAKIPLSGVPALLDGYRQESGEPTPPDGGSWEGRVLWHHLVWALGRLPDAVPRPGERPWTAPPAGRLLGLLRFFAQSPPAPWADLV
ncbi:aminoglycoside phosphotransferase family protein [Streptomyces sp. CC219B]|uniref:phosphotransferase family protein n=1 Tax=Streptomyces sp. CC219B TaxID=3044574 RepID=UPI0024A9FF87|nr:aminoglycoside phosphotransferase family protein [Streptomyces sp. CC219B]